MRVCGLPFLLYVNALSRRTGTAAVISSALSLGLRPIRQGESLRPATFATR